jgi:hypothetical protein
MEVQNGLASETFPFARASVAAAPSATSRTTEPITKPREPPGLFLMAILASRPKCSRERDCLFVPKLIKDNLRVRLRPADCRIRVMKHLGFCANELVGSGPFLALATGGGYPRWLPAVATGKLSDPVSAGAAPGSSAAICSRLGVFGRENA